MIKTVNGSVFRKMIIAAASLLDQNKKSIDALNVFPVPDGDTGTNMNLTFRSVVNEIGSVHNNNLQSLCEAATKGALRGARGNSGVILSQILKGICSVLSTCNDEKGINTKTFAQAFLKGTETAYKAVTKPREGTMLTVIRIMADAAMLASKKIDNFEEFFTDVLEKGEQVLLETPEMLPVLKKAGVVDAGGRGLIVIFSGFFKAVLGDENFNYVVNDAPANLAGDDEDNGVDLNELGEIEFAYCTEFKIVELLAKTTLSDIDKLSGKLQSIGDSVLCVGDLSLIKIHVHTNEPGKALSWAVELGEIVDIKIDNMLEQNRELKKAQLAKKPKIQKPFAIVAVCAGDGLAAVFKDTGCDFIVEGGQSMNPSADDIAQAVERVNSDNVIVLPNNSNIILAAQQAQHLTNKKILVVPTKNIAQGISALLVLATESTAEENFAMMSEMIDSVKSGCVTYAVRSTNMDGFKLKQNDIIGLNDKKILTKGADISKTTEALVEKLVDEGSSNIMLFYGKDIKQLEANTLADTLTKKYPDIEVNMIYGGQPVYYYLVSVE